MNIQERFSLRKSAVGLVSVSLLCAIHTSTVAADTVVTGVNEIIEESQVKDEASIESEKNESLDGSNLEIVEEIADNIPSPVIAEGEVAVEMKVDGGTENVVSRNDTEVKTSEQNQIEIAETKEILNQTSYQTESGEQRQIIWAHGITPPAMEQSGGFVKEKYGDYLNYTAPFEAGKGYYDTNKSLNASFIDLNLCFAAVSSNMVHWWLEQNSSYVERYLKEKNGTVNVGENYAITDLRRYIDSFQDQQNSRVFDMFKTYYGYRTNGFVSDALVDLFINGYKPKVQGGVNLEDSQLVPDSRGGFFYDVFKEKKLTNRIFSGSYERFGEDVRTVLESKGLLGLTYRTLGYATHIVTVWGAEYDNQGKIRAVYITDSDDQQEQIGLKRMGITRDASGNPRLNNHVKNNSAGAPLDYVHTIRLGQDLWEEYFNPLAKAKEIASQTLADAKKALVLSIQGQSELSESGRVTYLEKLDRLYDQGVLAIQKAESSELLNVALEDSLKSLDFPMSAVGESLTAELPAGELPPNADENSQLSQEICSADGKEEKGDVALVVDSINQPVLPVDDQAILPVAVIGEPVNDEQLVANENQSQSTIALGEETQVEGSDLPVVVAQDAVKNDEVVPVEELRESETVENQRSELLSGPIGMEGVNVKEEDQVATTATEQPATSKTTTVQASLDEPAGSESEPVFQPASISSPDRSAIPVQPEVTEVSVEVGETAIPPVALPETVSAPVVQAPLDEPASAESEPVSQPAPISSQDRSDVPIQPEVTEVSVEVGETAIPPVALPETISAPVVEASLDELASSESEPVSQPAPISSPDRSAIPVQPEVSVEVGETAIPPVALPETISAPVVEASLDEPASAESEPVSQPVPISSPDRSAIPVQPEVTEVAVEVGETAIPPVALPETVSAPVVEASLDESAGVESETVAKTEVASQEEIQDERTVTEQLATTKTTTVEASLDEPASAESEPVFQPAPISSPDRSAIPVQPEVAVESGEIDIPPVALLETVSAPVVQASLDESASSESETVIQTETTLVPVAEDIPVLPGHSAIRVVESVATSSTISEKHKFVDGGVSSALKVDSEGVTNESNAPRVEFLTEVTTESVLAEADRSSILTETKVIQPNTLMNDLESKEKILVPKSKSLDSVKMDMSSQEIVLPEVPEREPQMFRREMDEERKETELFEMVGSVAIVGSTSQSSNNMREYGQNPALHSKTDTKQVLSVEQSSKPGTNASGQIIGVSLLTLLLGSVWGLLKKASRKQ
ncbi:TPA: IdeS/Mac family cysteine endopeptidase [Streptococcus suis]|uniref:IdeS/Mac family cysteine endopeptidase n=1 Tax=Streptococcus suis TaxID=1307 RepID=UPI00069831B8|nr:IdeS/Mac family cysteine endopeptidase [Streptococcus suis]NQN12547.1 YSIRK-type signal peptide-containing protein [Streptococcus suis]NQN60732.1 YSIRK-type signal peptide-containing protein [Streptococcus suis]NQO47580.1 YSIRK-type signal peptide-containing protein [Streptococcus suis]NQQ57746.1 YSIRK-type signal peptide-containing protein [Streptococcus suis]NQR94704.1 YSIRK-type signal peptide-containing protein [Streptococcus suis]